MKQVASYSCAACNAHFPKWEGKCRNCEAWGTLIVSAPVKAAKTTATKAATSLRNFSSPQGATRFPTGDEEFDRVLGGGVVAGALILIGGDPGVGKSTLLLQIARHLALANRSILYVSGEESGEQVRLRLNRLGGITNDALHFLDEPTIANITHGIATLKPALVVIDSLQTMRTERGATANRPRDLADATDALLEIAKHTATPIVIIGHVTKTGGIAGPKLIEHTVDTVLYFEKSDDGLHRILRAIKNRFGGITEIGVWQMAAAGLCPVQNPSATFIDLTKRPVPGTMLAPLVQGSRVFLVEVQALLSPTRSGNAKRRSSGFDTNRLQLITAVIEKQFRKSLSNFDIHCNLVGGLKVTEPALDLPVALAIISAIHNLPVPRTLMAYGELGLHGDVRPVSEAARRLETAKRLGITAAIIASPRVDEKLPSQPKKLIAQTLLEATTLLKTLSS
ncbi:MAG: DNA repair protein RadA [Patescibacteria group bacterium]